MKGHVGSIEDRSTAAGRVYWYLRDRAGQWVSNRELALEADTVAVSTRISEVRRQLETRGERIETDQQRDGRKKRWFYRLVSESGATGRGVGVAAQRCGTDEKSTPRTRLGSVANPGVQASLFESGWKDRG